MRSNAKTVEACLEELPEDRRDAIAAARDVIRMPQRLPRHLGKGDAISPASGS